MFIKSFIPTKGLLKKIMMYNAGQKRRKLWIKNFSCPPLKEGAQLWTQLWTQPNILKHHYSTPSSLINCLQSWYTPSRELTKNSWIRVAFLLTSIVLSILLHDYKLGHSEKIMHFDSRFFSKRNKWARQKTHDKVTIQKKVLFSIRSFFITSFDPPF